MAFVLSRHAREEIVRRGIPQTLVNLYSTTHSRLFMNTAVRWHTNRN
jgi:hypothetical protein